MKPRIRIIGFSLIFILLSHFSLAQVHEKIVTSDKQKVLLSQEITFYGLDFSSLILVNAEKLTQGESIKNTFCPAWIGMFDEGYTKTELEKLLMVEVINDNRYPFQSDQYLKNDPSKIVSMYAVNMSIDDLEAIVNEYQLEENSGIGLSMIVAEFNKPKEVTTSYITFFDIASRELLLVVKVKGAGKGMGMTSHWYNGFNNSWYYYFYEVFRWDKRKAIREAKRASI